ncbi:flagellar hook protein [Tardiphaga alba]|uniref:Flagellin n=1 Tax=Tardiphaga alba TaxID=340268 RepID=A0ABX8AB38_9BRAD|nr:flagellin [Tardiphaga alba]QUS40988.1 flagellar hook protein [Tardiphaga alba]
MSGITLSASVRQNLLSLQSTADLLATTQGRLSSGNKVNSALDNPTNFFTAQSLNNRASDINNLLDGIGNGVQVIQAANTGITSLQKLVDSAKSIANQALQATTGYTKSSVTSNTSGATATNLLGTTAIQTSSVTGTAVLNNNTAVYSAHAGAAGTAVLNDNTGTAVAITGVTKLSGTAGAASDNLATAFIATDTIVANGKTIAFNSGAGTTGSIAAGNLSIDITTGTVQDVLTAINTATGGTSGISAGSITLTTGTTADIALSGTGVAKLGLGTTYAASRNSAPATATPIVGTTKIAGATGQGALATNLTTSDTITVNGRTISFFDSGAGGSAGSAANTTYFDLATATVEDVLDQVDTYSGGAAHSYSNGKITLNASTTADLVLGGTGLTKLGLVAGTTAASKAADAGLTGKTLTIEATGGPTSGAVATNITFGTGTSQISTLDQLNKELAKNFLQASISTKGEITITTTNDAASSSIGVIGGTATAVGSAFESKVATAAVADAASQATRASFVSQFNQVIDNIRTTAQDASFNGVNLLNGDTLSLTFNETGKSKLDISGASFGPDGLGLSSLAAGTDFIDNASTNKILASLTNASSKLRSQASAFGSNLSIVQMRQDFSKNLINVLQTGASNLTLADTNEEAANSQALSTRQSIAVSSLALANQSQQGVLQLLR